MFDSYLETKLYSKEAVELPNLCMKRLPRVECVHQPKDSAELQKVLSFCQKHRLSLIPRGAATSGIGAVAPLRKSVMVDLTLFRKICDFDEKRMAVDVQAGLRWWELKQFLRENSADVCTCPTSLFSTVGGWLATGGYGINSFKYGHLANLVEEIEVITPEKTMVIKRGEERFKYFVGTEGQMGIISRVKFKIRRKKPSQAFLVFFTTASRAVKFLTEVSKSPRLTPSHLSFLDRNRLEHKNLMLSRRVFFPSREAVLVVFEDGSPGEEFWDLVERREGILAEDYLTSFLWNERFFPFSLKHFYPSILGCEAILPLERMTRYIENLSRFSKNYGLYPGTEATLISDKEVLVFTLFPSDPKTGIFYGHLLLSYALSRLAMDSGGKPYGIGTWNLPLLSRKFTREEIKEYRLFKKAVDPMNLMNPGKCFSRDERISALLKAAYFLSACFSSAGPALGFFFRKQKAGFNGRRTFFETEACANCGACTVVCPAYLIEQNEIVTAKGKLYLLKKMMEGDSLPKSLAEKVFLCSHCHLCEKVCQSKLTLVPLWESLEKRMEKKFGYPREKVDRFISQIESSPEYERLLGFLNNNHHDLPEETHV